MNIPRLLSKLLCIIGAKGLMAQDSWLQENSGVVANNSRKRLFAHVL
jgi:hypothetical protein